MLILPAEQIPTGLHPLGAERVCQTVADARWYASPSAGVVRRPLMRLGGERACATSVVRYAAGSRFAWHVHAGGEEILVLSGVFSDQLGDHVAGTYLRNPVGSGHAPFSATGCEILVRLWQMAATDQRQCVQAPTDWLWHSAGALQRCELHQYAQQRVYALRLPIGQPQQLSFAQAAELWVCAGAWVDAAGQGYATGTWLRFAQAESLWCCATQPDTLLYVYEGWPHGLHRATL